MKTLFFVSLGCFFAFSAATAQTDHKLDDQIIQTDKAIRAQITKPFIAAADQQNQPPDWKVLRTTIVAQYGDAYAGRIITKGRLIYYYSKDWPQFSSALVQYTNNYEYRDSLSLMNMNAKMVLDHSDSPADLKAALSWAKYASDKNPSNEEYKATYDALSAQITGR
jgi:predicted  nucleic acid-binding Zn ribbon protein